MNFARIRTYVLVFSALATTVLSNIGQAQPPASWQLKAPMPTGRYGAPAAVIDGRLYVASGCCNDPFNPFPSRPNVLEVYDPGSNSWTTRAPIPIPLYAAPNGVINGRWYIAGGQPCCQNIDDLQIYDPLTDRWSFGARVPDRSGAGAGGVINGELYVAGGMDPGNNFPVRLLRIYNPLTNVWRYGPLMPTARANLAGAVIGDKLYVVGGGDGAGLHRELEIFDPATNSWSTGPLMPTGRYGLAAGVVDGKLYAIGGYDNVSRLNVVEVFDPVSNTWSSIAPTIEPHLWPSVGTIGTTLYVVGGSNAFTPIGRTNEAYVPAVTKIAPTLTISGGTFPFDGLQHQVVVTATGTNGVIVAGQVSVSYSPGGFAPPFNAGTYSAAVTFTSGDPAYADATASAQDIITITKATPFVNVNGGTFMYNGSQHSADVTATGVNGFFLNGSFAVSYMPGGASAPKNVGSYDVLAAFDPADSVNYTPATATAAIVINPSTAFVSGPQSVTAEATSFAGAVPNFFVSASDFDGPLTPNCQPAGPGSVFPLGTTQVTCTAQGANSLPGSASFPVIVRDTQAPIIGNPSNVTAPATSSQGANVTFTLPSATDVADPNPVVTASPASGALFPHGNTTVTVTARDVSGNTSTRNFTVTVTAALLSINVTPGSATISPGNSRSFTANGVFTDGSTRTLPSGSGGGGGGGGNSGPGNFAWQVRFLPTFPVGACTPVVNGGLSSQAFSGVNGVVDTSWGQGNFLHVTGTINPTAVSLSIACATSVSPAPPVLSLSATWTGTRYDGTLIGYAGETIPVRITGWSSKAPMPTPRFALGAATINVNGHDVVFAAGGASGNSLLDTLEAYDPPTDSWSTVASMPTRREGPGVVALNGKLYVVGGNVSGGVPSGIVEVYDPIANSWSSSLPPLPTPRSHFSLVAAGGQLYAIGGDIAANNTAVTNIVERLDPSQPAPAWATMNPMPTPRRFMAAGALNAGSLIVVVGGQQVNGPAMNRTELYNVATNQWSQGANILAPTVGAASAVVSNALFVFGGFNNGPLTLAELYRPAANSQLDGWAALSGMPTVRGEAAAAAVDDVIYVIGGENGGSPPAGMSTLEAFSILAPDQFSLSQGTSGGGGGGSGTPAVTWRVSPNNGVATISPFGNAFGNAVGQVSVIAEAGSVSCVTTNTCATLTVANTNPTVGIYAGGPVTIDVGMNLSASGGSPAGSFGDPDNGQSWTATVDYGDGGGAQPLALTPGPGQGSRGAFDFNHVYTRPGHFTVVVTVRDNAGGQGSASLAVNVVDRDPPVLSLPGNIVAEATGPGGASVSYSASALDAVDGSVPASCDHPSGSPFPMGTTTVKCAASDSSGNGANGSFTVTVVDTTPPAIGSVTPSVTVLGPPNHKLIPVTLAVQVSDLVDSSPVCEVVAVASNEPPAGAGSGNTPSDWEITPGSLTVSLRAERDGAGGGRIYTITVRCRDASGNASTATSSVSVDR